MKKFTKGLKVGSLYHSKTNNKVVRLTEFNARLKICTIKNHSQDHMFESEVFEKDLIVATSEQVKAYFKR